MDKDERHGKIIEVVMGEGEITIAGISQMFDVSEMTARRDLNELDRQGVLRRVHGGAIANFGRSYEPPFQIRQTKNLREKSAIAKEAAKMIYDGDSLVLDVGTTTLEVAKEINDQRNLTIITNCLQIANHLVTTLSLDVDARLIITGGIIRPRELSMVGGIPERVYQEYHVDKAFIGIGGISIKSGLTEYNIEDAEIKRVLLESARENIVVADSSKFGLTTFTSVAPLTKVDKIITDAAAPADMVDEIRELGVEVALAEV